MSYASQANIEASYPGELAQAGPKVAGALNPAAIALALSVADTHIDRALRTIGWTVPLSTPYPFWVVQLAVDLALYLATPTALASQDDFKDRKARYEAALTTLDDIAALKRIPPPLAGSTPSGVFFSSNARQFSRGVL